VVGGVGQKNNYFQKEFDSELVRKNEKSDIILKFTVT
jgi:hypothetical protein